MSEHGATSGLDAEGVYLETDSGQWQCVHVYQNGDYGLEDVAEYLGIGEVQRTGQGMYLHLTRRQLRELRLAADAYSFDYEPEFIEMCLAMERVAGRLPREDLRFYANF